MPEGAAHSFDRRLNRAPLVTDRNKICSSQNRLDRCLAGAATLADGAHADVVGHDDPFETHFPAQCLDEQFSRKRGGPLRVNPRQ